MLPQQLQYSRMRFHELILDASKESFEDLFHRLMELAHPDFLSVRTHGNLGDIGADGLCTDCRKLYACYGPESPDPSGVKGKIESDLKKAIQKRSGQFDTFVFVHNDRRGIHPVVSGTLSDLAVSFPSIKMHPMGPRKMWNEAMRFDIHQMTDFLGENIPVNEVRYDMGLADVEPLLKHLADNRRRNPQEVEIEPPNRFKADYNQLSQDSKEILSEGRIYAPIIEAYYRNNIDTTERDETAESFKFYYQRCVEESNGDPDEVIWQMQAFIIGQGLPRRERRLMGDAVLAYFFDQCDIFEIPPRDWHPPQFEDVSP
jgi:hypothetical protein